MADLPSRQYSIKFRCPNCGSVFSKCINKGDVALGNGGNCMYCGVKDGQTKVGNFTVIKINPEYDK